MHNKPHTEEAKKKIREKQDAWRKTQAYKDFVERQRQRAKKSKTKFKKGHKIHEKHPHLKKNIEKYQSGKNHWNWKGGIVEETKKIRNSKKYREWRMGVFKRDEFTCQECGKNNCYLEADHYPIPFCVLFERKDDITMWNIDNGRALCRGCHNKTKLHWKEYYAKET